MRIDKNCVVKMSYQIIDNQGQTLDERTPDNPLEFIFGIGVILEKVEKVLQDQTSGFSSKIEVSPKEGFGEFRQDLVVKIPLAHFSPGIELKPGVKFQTQGPQGKPVTLTILEVGDQDVIADGNHPLSGAELIFDVRVLDVRKATPEELQSGRPKSVESEKA